MTTLCRFDRTIAGEASREFGNFWGDWREAQSTQLPIKQEATDDHSVWEKALFLGILLENRLE
jgi:hypothetical protein